MRERGQIEGGDAAQPRQAVAGCHFRERHGHALHGAHGGDERERQGGHDDGKNDAAVVHAKPEQSQHDPDNRRHAKKQGHERAEKDGQGFEAAGDKAAADAEGGRRSKADAGAVKAVAQVGGKQFVHELPGAYPHLTRRGQNQRIKMARRDMPQGEKEPKPGECGKSAPEIIQGFGGTGAWHGDCVKKNHGRLMMDARFIRGELLSTTRELGAGIAMLCTLSCKKESL